MAIYVAAFGIIEAKYERDINRAFIERNDIMTRLNSGNASVFIAAMKDFGRVQTIESYIEPELLKGHDHRFGHLKSFPRFALIVTHKSEVKYFVLFFIVFPQIFTDFR